MIMLRTVPRIEEISGSVYLWMYFVDTAEKDYPKSGSQIALKALEFDSS